MHFYQSSIPAENNLVHELLLPRIQYPLKIAAAMLVMKCLCYGPRILRTLPIAPAYLKST